MLTHNRADYYIDALTEVDFVVSRANDPAQFRKTHIAELPLYLCFANTSTGPYVDGAVRQAHGAFGEER